jgi:hypothetical protein
MVKRTGAAAVWLIAFLVYYNTLAPSVGFIDSGELAAVADRLGIAHPTGYPLYTLLGRLFAVLPIASEVIVRLNILSAVLTATSVSFIFLFLIELLDDEKKSEQLLSAGAAIFSSLLLAFSRTFWLQGVSAEVYSLHLMLIASVLYCFQKAVRTAESRWWLLFAYSVGLAFTNHMTTILLAPALLYWFFAEHGFAKQAFKKILVLSLPFVAGLSVYWYLPVRASQHPLLNWGNPQTAESFWWHFTGKQFRVWMFSSGDVAHKQLNYFVNTLPVEFHSIGLVVALIGAVMMLFTDRRKFLVVFLLFVSCVAYSINYDIQDIDSYFLLAFIAVAVFTAYGVMGIIRRFSHRNAQMAAGIAACAVLLVHSYGNWKEADQSGNYMVEDYTKNILHDLPHGAMVISSQWDYFVSSSLYYQHVEGLRSDVIVLDKELFRRSWYFAQLEHVYPGVMRKSALQSSAFQKELFKFEHDIPYEYAAIEGGYAALLKSFADQHAPFPVYITPEIEPNYFPGYIRIPEGFLFRLSRDTSYQSVPFPRTSVRKHTGTDIYSNALRSIMANALMYRAQYEKFYGFDSLSRFYSQKASEFTAKRPFMVSKF